jgi:hypothetical protein
MKPLEAGTMDPRRWATRVGSWQAAVVPACVAVWLVAFGSPGIDKTGAAQILKRAVPALTADARPTDRPRSITTGSIANANAMMTGDVPKAAAADTTLTSFEMKLPEYRMEPAVPLSPEPPTTAASEPVSPVAHEPEPAAAPEPEKIVVASLTDSSETLPAEKPPVETAIANTPAAESSEPASAPAVVKSAVGSDEVLDECYVMETCIDRFLFALYQRTPKEDSVKQQDHRQVTVKRKGKQVTITRTFTQVVDEDFAWKDPKAAEKAGMSMMDYVIGGMDASFKLKLFHLLLAAEQAGFQPGITSAFRDDYRQSIAAGLKAANDRSYHGGSFRGGYGHGLAADVVSVNGGTRALRQASSENFWSWIDKHGKDYGIGRPYLARDPPHVGPIDGQEYISRRGTGSKQAAASLRKRSQVAAAKHHDGRALIRSNCAFCSSLSEP